MEEEDWAWVCTCGAVIPRGPEGRERETAQAHAAEHRFEISEAGGRKFGPVPPTLVPLGRPRTDSAAPRASRESVLQC